MKPVKQAMILAAGRGERFRPVTDTIPKPLVEVRGKPLIDWQLEMLKANGIERVVINVCYLKELLLEHLERWQDDFEIIISEEMLALETGGGIKNALHHFNDECFYSLNSDVILYPSQDMLLVQLERAFEVRKETKIALLLHYKTHSVGMPASAAGDFFCDEYGALQRRGEFKEAPFYFTGVQLMHPSIFNDVDDSIFSMNLIFNTILEHTPEQIAGVINQYGSMLHVGDPEGHSNVEAFMRDFSESMKATGKS